MSTKRVECQFSIPQKETPATPVVESKPTTDYITHPGYSKVHGSMCNLPDVPTLSKCIESVEASGGTIGGFRHVPKKGVSHCFFYGTDASCSTPQTNTSMKLFEDPLTLGRKARLMDKIVTFHITND